MDYGKTAYLRTEELEARVNKLSAPKKERNVYASAEPDREIKDGRKQELFAVNGSGVVALNIKITATVYSVGGLRLYAGGKRLGLAEFPSQGRCSEIIVACAAISEPTYLLLKPENGFFGIIHRAEAAVSGADASVSIPPFSLCADSDGSVTAALWGKNDRINIGIFSDVSGVKTYEKQLIGSGNFCDVVYGGDGSFAAVYRDGFGGIWGIKLTDGVITRRRYLFEGADGLAVERRGGGFTIAFVRGGEVYTCFTDSDFGGCTRPEKTDFPYAAESVAFVKGSAEPSIAVCSGGKSFLKIGEHEKTAVGAVTAELSFSASK